MNKFEYKKILNDYKTSLKEFETKCSISLFAYDKYYNSKIDELYKVFINLKKSRQLKAEYITNLESNQAKKTELYKSCIEKEINEFNLSIDEAYNRLVLSTKIKNDEYYKRYENLVNSYSLTYENTIDRLNKEIEQVLIKKDEANLKRTNDLGKKIEEKTIEQKNLFIKLNTEKNKIKNNYIKVNTSINNLIMQNRRNFLSLDEQTQEKFHNLISECDKRIENAKSDLIKNNKSIILEFNNKLNSIEEKYNNEFVSINELEKLKIESTNHLKKINEKKLAELSKDNLTEIAKIESINKINIEKTSSNFLRKELEFTRKKKSFDEALVVMTYENSLENSEIIRSFNEEVCENEINKEISIISNQINILKRKRDLIITNEEELRNYNVNKLKKRKEEISVLNMLKCENEKINRDCDIDIEYLKLNASKCDFDLQKIVFENNKYLELLDFCKLINIKSYKEQSDYYNEIKDLDSLIILCEKNVDDEKNKYTSFHQTSLINQRISSIKSEQAFISNFISLAKKDFVFEKNSLKRLKIALKLFFYNKINEPDSLESQKSIQKQKYEKEISHYTKIINEKNKEYVASNNKREYVIEDLQKNNNYIIYYENEISTLETSLKNESGNIEELNEQLNEAHINLNNHKTAYNDILLVLKKIDKNNSLLKREIQVYEKRIESLKYKINSKYLHIENSSYEKTLYLNSYKKILNYLNLIAENEKDVDLTNNCFEKISSIANTLYNSLLQLEYNTLKSYKARLLEANKESNNNYLNTCKNIKAEYDKNIYDLEKNKNINNKNYLISKNEYLNEISKAKENNSKNIKIIYEEIRQRRNKKRLDILSFKNNSYMLKKSFEKNLNESLIKVEEKIVLNEKEFYSYVKKTKEFNKEYAIKTKNNYKQILYNKNYKMKVATSKLKANEKQLLKEKHELNKSEYIIAKEKQSNEKDVKLYYKSLIKKNSVTFRIKEIKWEKEFRKITKKENKILNDKLKKIRDI